MIRMRSFTERNPVVIGVIVVAIISVGTGAALLLNSGALADRYQVRARFTDSAGVTPGTKVRVAGITSGAVEEVRQAGGQVEVVLGVDAGIELPADTRADIVVETLLGQKSVRLVPGDDWDRLLQDGAVITDTTTPIEALDLQNIGTPLLEEIDGEAIDSLIDKVATVTEGKRQDVGDIIEGLERLARTVNAREAQARSLVDSARTLTDTLADRDEDLLAAVDDLDEVVQTLVSRRTELVQLLEATSEAAQRTADLIGGKAPEIDRVLDELHADLEIVGRHQVDLAQTIALVSSAIEGFASVGYSGEAAEPTTWANVYLQLIGPLGPDAILGSCGALDVALDLSIGPDPLADCDARTGPMAGSAGPGQPGDTRDDRGAGGTEPGPTSSLDGVYDDALGGGAG